MITLVIVPCGAGKVWDREPSRGPTPAKDAYTGAPFKVNREYAVRLGDAWVILSAKYGFISPDFMIPESYETTFKRKNTQPITIDALRQQVTEQQLDRFDRVIGLGGIEYRRSIEAAFTGSRVEMEFPFAGLPIGRMMQATKAATVGNAGHHGDSRDVSQQ